MTLYNEVLSKIINELNISSFRAYIHKPIATVVFTVANNLATDRVRVVTLILTMEDGRRIAYEQIGEGVPVITES